MCFKIFIYIFSIVYFVFGFPQFSSSVTPDASSLQGLVQRSVDPTMQPSSDVAINSTPHGTVERPADQNLEQQGKNDTNEIFIQIIKNLTLEQKNEIKKILSQTQQTKKEIKKQLEIAFNNWQKSEEYTQAEDKINSFVNTLKGKSGNHPAIQKFVDIVHNDDLTLEQEKEQLKQVFETASKSDIQTFVEILDQQFPDVKDKLDFLTESENDENQN